MNRFIAGSFFVRNAGSHRRRIRGVAPVRMLARAEQCAARLDVQRFDLFNDGSVAHGDFGVQAAFVRPFRRCHSLSIKTSIKLEKLRRSARAKSAPRLRIFSSMEMLCRFQIGFLFEVRGIITTHFLHTNSISVKLFFEKSMGCSPDSRTPHCFLVFKVAGLTLTSAGVV